MLARVVCAIVAWFERQWWYWIDAPRQVRAGAELLDEHKPKWFRVVRLAGLNQADPWDCVLAQVYGSYTAGLAALEVGGAMHLYGYDLSIAAHEGPVRRHWRRLDRLWDNEILARSMDDIIENSRRDMK